MRSRMCGPRPWFNLLYDAFWRQQVTVGLGDREPVRFRQFIYP